MRGGIQQYTRARHTGGEER